jgi:hypothetical protein
VSVHRWSTEYIYLVVTEFASPDHEAEWCDWYDTVHIPDMLSVPGVRHATRYREIGGDSLYVAIYDIDGPHVFDSDRYREVTGWGRWHPFVREWTRTITHVELGPQAFTGGAGA